jgi:hypothetical protein
LSIFYDVSKGHYRLARDFKVIYKVLLWYNGTLGDKSRTIVVVGGLLEEAMPMLQEKHIKIPKAHPRKRKSYNRSYQVQGRIVE